MAQQQNHSHAALLPSFLFQLMADRNIDPVNVGLVVDNAAASPYPLMKETFSAPSLFTAGPAAAQHPITPLSSNRHYNSASLVLASSPQSTTNNMSIMMAKGNARWSPIGSSPRRAGAAGSPSPVSVRSQTIKDLLRRKSSSKRATKTGKQFPLTGGSMSKSKNNKLPPVAPQQRGDGSEVSPPAFSSTPFSMMPRLCADERTSPASSSAGGGDASTLGGNRSFSMDSLLIKPSRRGSPNLLTTLKEKSLSSSSDDASSASTPNQTLRKSASSSSLPSGGVSKNASLLPSALLPVRLQHAQQDKEDDLLRTIPEERQLKTTTTTTGCSKKNKNKKEQGGSSTTTTSEGRNHHHHHHRSFNYKVKRVDIRNMETQLRKSQSLEDVILQKDKKKENSHQDRRTAHSFDGQILLLQRGTTSSSSSTGTGTTTTSSFRNFDWRNNASSTKPTCRSATNRRSRADLTGEIKKAMMIR